MDSFFQIGPASASYETVRDASDLAHVRILIDQLWAKYRPPADPHFLEDAKKHFHQRTWELYLWHVLNFYCHSPQKDGPVGPDLFFMSGGQRTWVEAVAPSRGTGPDAVPMLEVGETPIAQDVPEEAIILRFTNALQDKLRKYGEYRSKGIVQSKDRFIIAINGCEAKDYRGEPQVPYVIKATIALGDLQVSFDPTGVQPSRSRYQRRAVVRKQSQQSVSTDLFMKDEYRPVSAILYSPKDICNVPERIGSEMYYFHNPLAENPIPRGIFRFCREYWVDLDHESLKFRDWHLE